MNEDPGEDALQESAPRDNARQRLHPYDPNRLLDRIKRQLKLVTDSHLARVLGIAPQRISKIRYRINPISAAVLIRMTEVTNVDLPELRRILGDRRRKQRMGPEHFRPRRRGCKTLPGP